MPKPKKAADQKNCEACRHFKAEPKDDLGLCKRLPPVLLVVADEVVCAFPTTCRTDEPCGEFAQKLQS